MSKVKLLIVFVIAAGILTAILASALFATFSKQTSGNTDDWSLVVNGLVQNPLNLTLDELNAMPRTTVSAVLYCVDYPSYPVAQGNWTGVKLSLLLEKAEASPDAVKIAFTASGDGYATDLTVSTTMRPDIIIAYELNGEPLSEKLRLVVPGKWGYKWISYLNHIELVNFDFKGFWESRGYSDEGEIPASP
ncbi:MAG TPA: molybdopterin-dependent oxidoreductase [Candidatus Bathyarchaeia archaeon]